jgi:hypothetical protein
LGKISMSLICKIFGHKWEKFVVTGQQLAERDVHSGFGVTLGTENYVRDVGYDEQFQYCLRCGKPNPNYKEDSE